MKLSRRQNWMNFSRADSRLRMWSFSGVLRTDSLPVFRVCWWFGRIVSFGSTKPPATPWKLVRSYFPKRWKNIASWRGCLSEKFSLKIGGYVTKIEWEVVDGIDLAHDRHKWPAVVNSSRQHRQKHSHGLYIPRDLLAEIQVPITHVTLHTVSRMTEWIYAHQGIYRYAPHNDVSVNDGPHMRRWSYKIIIL